jgi:hypothetical protein
MAAKMKCQKKLRKKGKKHIILIFKNKTTFEKGQMTSNLCFFFTYIFVFYFQYNVSAVFLIFLYKKVYMSTCFFQCLHDDNLLWFGKYHVYLLLQSFRSVNPASYIVNRNHSLSLKPCSADNGYWDLAQKYSASLAWGTFVFHFVLTGRQ